MRPPFSTLVTLVFLTISVDAAITRPSFRDIPSSFKPRAGLINTRTDPQTMFATVPLFNNEWASKTFVNPVDPKGYKLVFGPTRGTNDGPGYMGFASIDKYDVDACATLCNAREDPLGGVCRYFNIWRTVGHGITPGITPAYTCSFYYLVADESSAVNYGQGNLKVTHARGYMRQSVVIDGGFEELTCPDGKDGCYAASYAHWIGTSDPGGYMDATIFRHKPYAYTGNGVGLLGSAFNHDNISGTLTPRKGLITVPGNPYFITFWHSSSFAHGCQARKAFVDVFWNGQLVQTISPGCYTWTPYTFGVIGTGNDTLELHGGTAPSWSLIDDVAVFMA